MWIVTMLTLLLLEVLPLSPDGAELGLLLEPLLLLAKKLLVTGMKPKTVIQAVMASRNMTVRVAWLPSMWAHHSLR